MFVIFSLNIFLIRFQIWSQGEDRNDNLLLFYDGAVSLCCRYGVTPGMRAGKTRSVPTRWEIIANVRSGVGQVDANGE